MDRQQDSVEEQDMEEGPAVSEEEVMDKEQDMDEEQDMVQEEAGADLSTRLPNIYPLKKGPFLMVGPLLI